MKTKKIIVPRQLIVALSLLTLLLFMGALLKAAIPASERAALIAIYNSTAGHNWNDNSGWKEGVLEEDGFAAVGTEGDWFGVTVTGDHITRISFIANNLYGTLPSEIGDFTHLDFLKIRYNNMWGDIPAELGNLSRLTLLDLVQNHLSGNIPPGLGNLTALRTLYIQDSTLRGGIPSELGNLSNLESLTILAMYLSGPLPAELGNLSKLQTLTIKRVQVTGGIPAELWHLTNLTSLTLYECGIGGEIPPEIGNLVALEHLDLARNEFSGAFPAEIMNLTALKYLDLAWNEFFGPIPAGISKLTALETLSLAFNRISGPIPPALGDVVSLRYLDLYKNELDCSLPPELGNLVNLNELNFKCSRLYGCIPSTLTNLTNLTDIGLNNNRFYTDDETLSAFLNSINPTWRRTQTVAPANLSAEPLTTESLKVDWNPIPYNYSSGGYRVYYSTTSGGPWTEAGMTEDKKASSFTITGLTAGTDYYIIVKTQTNSDSWCIVQDIVSEASDELAVRMPDIPVGRDQAPFGTFETPVSGNIPVSGSIAVTGWALDDISVESVKIYYVDGNDKAYIGDAVFVEGARPDVAADYPDIPNNNRAGWGYMMLTHFLPNGGNGTCMLQAVAADYVGNETVLDTKTIVVDNTGAVKPFGAIDTPAQGGTASGSRYVNYGWALTPQPNLIPFDGKTITVWVDGRALGHPGYNVYRDDVATLLPDYRNSNGAMGYYHLDTTRFANGVHTIAWSVTDDAGHVDGIGSRYFNIFNADAELDAAQAENGQEGADELSAVGVVKGFRRDIEPQPVYPGAGGERAIFLKPMERLAIHLKEEGAPVGSGEVTGFLLKGNQLKRLPIGSTLDSETGIFYWQPGPGFMGDYPLVFMVSDGHGNTIRKNIRVRLGSGAVIKKHE